MPNHSELTGLVMWVVLIAASFWWRARFQKRGASPSTVPTEGTGPKWEQDEPYALMLDDLDDEEV